MATTIGTIIMRDQGLARLIDDLAHRGITVTMTPSLTTNDVAGGVLGSVAVTIPDSSTNNATWGALGQLYGTMNSI